MGGDPETRGRMKWAGVGVVEMRWGRNFLPSVFGKKAFAVCVTVFTLNLKTLQSDLSLLRFLLDDDPVLQPTLSADIRVVVQSRVRPA